MAAEQIAYNFKEFKAKLKESEEWLAKEFVGIRTGRATPALLDSVSVESYGSRMQIAGLASVNIEDARTIRIAPWDATQTVAIEKAISIADLGVSTVVDEKGLRVIFPELTAERRVLLVRLAREKVEDAKVRIRMERDKVIKDIQEKKKNSDYGEDVERELKAEVDDMIKAQNAKFEELFGRKEKEILS
jgi:ribosome recycling factor